MSLKVYKTGQGYWTRVMSGLGFGLIVVIGAIWLWQELEVIRTDYRIYIQGGVALSLIAMFGYFIYRFVGSRPKSVDFLIATEGEMKKVNWPSRREVIGSTWIVICGLAILVGVIYLADNVFAWIATQTGVLEIGSAETGSNSQ